MSENSFRIRKWIEYGLIALFLVAIALLFLNTTPYYALFTGEQQTYYLHGLFMAGRDYLQNDWVSKNFNSYHIAFTFLVYFFDSQGLLEPAVNFLDIAFRLIFLASAWLLIYFVWNNYFIKGETSPLKKGVFPLVVLCVFSQSINPMNPLRKIFESMNLYWLGEVWGMIGDLGGFSKMWLYGYRVNPSSFAVFIFFGFSLLLYRRWIFAAVCFGIASLFHSPFLVHTGITIGICFVYLINRGEKRMARNVLIVFSLLTLPQVVYVLHGYITDSSTESSNLFFEIASDYKNAFYLWRIEDSVHLLIIVLAVILMWIIGKGWGFRWAFIGNAFYILLGIGISIIPNINFMRVLIPWRGGAYLYPISLLILFLVIVYYAANLLERLTPLLKYVFPILSIALLIAGINKYGLLSPKKNIRYERSDHRNYPFYILVQENTTPEDIILVPIEDGAIRLDAQRAVYVDGENFPGWGSILVEWKQRVDFASNFFNSDGDERQVLCHEAGVDYYALYDIEPSQNEPVIVTWEDKALIECPMTDSD